MGATIYDGSATASKRAPVRRLSVAGCQPRMPLAAAVVDRGTSKRALAERPMRITGTGAGTC